MLLLKQMLPTHIPRFSFFHCPPSCIKFYVENSDSNHKTSSNFRDDYIEQVLHEESPVQVASFIPQLEQNILDLF